MKNLSKNLGRTVLHTGKFLDFGVIEYRDDEGKIRQWESADRVCRTDAALIIGRILPQNELLLIRQYRPACNAYLIEFPAGLREKDESFEACAHRELLEETGYRGEIRIIYPPAASSPGLTGETVAVVMMEIDGTLPQNQNANACPDAGEHIECLRIAMADLPEFFAARHAAGDLFDSKVYTYLEGIKYHG